MFLFIHLNLINLYFLQILAMVYILLAKFALFRLRIYIGKTGFMSVVLSLNP